MSKENIADKKSEETENKEVENQETIKAETEKQVNSDENSEQNEDSKNEEAAKVEDEKQAVEPEEVVVEEIDEEEKLRNELAVSKDKYLRLSAEFDNYRRRTLKEKMDLTKTAGENIMIKILPVVDDFERAMNSMKDSKDSEAIHEGILLIYNKFNEFIGQQGIKEIDSMHKEFDTDLHEALTKIPAPKKKLKGKVVDVVEKGYKLHDKVIRFSKVVIGE